MTGFEILGVVAACTAFVALKIAVVVWGVYMTAKELDKSLEIEKEGEESGNEKTISNNHNTSL